MPDKKMRLAVLTSGGDSAGMNAVVRAIVKTAILKCDSTMFYGCFDVGTDLFLPSRGCETYVVREGYEGLVRGNSEAGSATPPHLKEQHRTHSTTDLERETESFVNNLRFGDGDLLRDGTSDHPLGRTLKGRYIVRVGWDDVRGWFTQVCSLLHVCI